MIFNSLKGILRRSISIFLNSNLEHALNFNSITQKGEYELPSKNYKKFKQSNPNSFCVQTHRDKEILKNPSANLKCSTKLFPKKTEKPEKKKNQKSLL